MSIVIARLLLLHSIKVLDVISMVIARLILLQSIRSLESMICSPVNLNFNYFPYNVTNVLT